jgi:ABC-type multidrug transport system fused ATPase/permease subunit
MLINVLSIVFLQIFSYNIIIFLYEKILEKVLRSPLHLIFNNINFNDLLKYFNKDLSIVHVILPSLISQLTLIMTLALFPLIASGIIVEKVIPFTIGFAIVNLFLVRYYHKSISVINTLENKALRNIQLGTIEILEASTYIRTYQVGTHLLHSQTNRQTKLSDIILTREGVENWFRIRLNLLCIFVLSSIAVLFIFDYHETDPVILALILLGLSQLPTYLEKFYRTSDCLLTSMSSFKRIYCLHYIASEGRLNDDIELCETYGIIPHGKIQLLEVSTRYPGQTQNALNCISLTIKPTERIAVIGHNGAGKTTLTRILLRLQELTEGRIEIDGTEITDINLEILWDKISVITNQSPLYNSTLRHNIDPSGIYTDFEVVSSIKKARFEHFMKKCKNNLDTQIGRGGVKISNIDKKLIFVARAILKNSKIVIIEESGKLDITTGKLTILTNIDNLVQKIVREEMSGSTVITVAKNMSTVLDSTKVMILESGAVVEFATPKMLDEHVILEALS